MNVKNISHQIEEININDEPIAINIIADQNMMYKIIFELWIYDDVQGSFLFGWDFQQERNCVWNQLWFNVLTSSVESL